MTRTIPVDAIDQTSADQHETWMRWLKANDLDTARIPLAMDATITIDNQQRTITTTYLTANPDHPNAFMPKYDRAAQRWLTETITRPLITEPPSEQP